MSMDIGRIDYDMQRMLNFNPLLHEFFFSSVFKIKRKIGCYRLPTHKRGAHREFFCSSLLILKSKFWPYVHYSDRYATKG